jgi:ABC-type Fe3+ transport system substrate-binding protein
LNFRQLPIILPPMSKAQYVKLICPALLVGVLALPFALHRKPAEHSDSRQASGLPVKTLTIVSPHWEGIRTEFGRSFTLWTEQNLGHRTKIDWLDVGGTSDGVKFIQSEFNRKPDGIGVDIFFGGGIDPYIQFKKQKLLQPITVPDEVLTRIPPSLHGIEVYDPGMEWFGACLGGFGIIYNIKVLELLHLPAPETWADLAKPQYFTWVASGDPRSSGTVHMVYEIILQAYGWDEGWRLITSMAGNIRNFSRSGSDAPRDTALGETACGLVIDVYAWRQVADAGADKIGFVFPPNLTVINPDAIAVLRGAPEKELAAHFVAFTLSDTGQKLWTLKNGTRDGPQEFSLGRMPVVPGFAEKFGEDAVIRLDPFKSPAGLKYDPEKGSARWTILNDLIGAVIIDPHHVLVDAWQNVKDHPVSAEHSLFTAAPVSEEECMRLAASDWQDPERRTAVKAEWSASALSKYKQLAGPSK